MNGSKDEWKFAPLGTRQRLGGRDPDALAGLQMIMRCLLLEWRGRHKEMRIEAFGHALGRDPVSKVSEQVGSQHQSFGMRHLDQRAFALVKGFAIGLETRRILGGYHKGRSIAIGEQDTGLLEEFANGSRSHTFPQHSAALRVGRRQSYRRTDALGQLGGKIVFRHRAAWKYIHVGHEIALNDAAHHKYFKSLSR